MDLRTTLLSLLNWRPCSGYDLKRIISDSDLYYWSGNNNQIYKFLLELQQQGWVTFESIQQASLPTKKIYSITESGRVALHESLMSELEVPELHKSFLIQLAWAETLTDAEVLGLLQKYEEEVNNGLRLAEGQQQRKQDQPAAPRASATCGRGCMRTSFNRGAPNWPGRVKRARRSVKKGIDHK